MCVVYETRISKKKKFSKEVFKWDELVVQLKELIGNGDRIIKVNKD